MWDDYTVGLANVIVVTWLGLGPGVEVFVFVAWTKFLIVPQPSNRTARFDIDDSTTYRLN